MFDSLAALLEMSSASFLKSISESNYDKLYDLPAGIPDVMGLQALRPSAAVCKVMSIPDSNSVRVIYRYRYNRSTIYYRISGGRN